MYVCMHGIYMVVRQDKLKLMLAGILIFGPNWDHSHLHMLAIVFNGVVITPEGSHNMCSVPCVCTPCPSLSVDIRALLEWLLYIEAV